MKKRVYWLVFLCLCVGTVASEPMMTRYFVEVGVDAYAPISGDLDGHTRLIVDTSQNNSIQPETTLVHQMTSAAQYNVRLGAHINQHSISLGAGFSKPWAKFHDNQIARGAISSLFSLGFEYQYHFLYPGIYRPSLGIGYGFNRWNVEKSALWTDRDEQSRTGKVVYSGNSPHVVLGLGYYGFPHFVIQTTARLRFLTIQNLTTPANDFNELTESLVQTLLEGGFSVQYVF